MTRIGLVLGAGGAVGHAFHAGVLAALGDATGWDARDADVIVGTSAGSVLGSLLRAGLSPGDLAARSTGGTVSSEGRDLVDRADNARAHLPPIPSRPPRRVRVPTMSAPGAFMRAAMQPWRARPAALLAAAMPEGRVPTELVASGLRPLFDTWPDAPLWINAVQLDRSRRVTFGRDTGVPEVDVATAVAASCAIPGFFEPVMIDGTRYVDGGVHSPTNADLVAGLELDLVIISSPMSVAGNAIRVAPDQPARRVARLALGREVGRVRAAGTPVLVFQPTRADIGVMGYNAMDPTRRAAITRQARASTRQRLVRPDVRDLVMRLAPTAKSRN